MIHKLGVLPQIPGLIQMNLEDKVYGQSLSLQVLIIYFCASYIESKNNKYQKINKII